MARRKSRIKKARRKLVRKLAKTVILLAAGYAARLVFRPKMLGRILRWWAKRQIVGGVDSGSEKARPAGSRLSTRVETKRHRSVEDDEGRDDESAAGRRVPSRQSGSRRVESGVGRTRQAQSGRRRTPSDRD